MNHSKPVRLGSPEPFALINRIPIIDNGEPLVDLLETTSDLLLSPGLLPYLRSGAKDMLVSAARSLPNGLRFRISTALRTHQMQADMYWRNFERIKTEHPAWPVSAVRRACNKYFAPPDYKAPPGHCTGGAVDLSLIDESGESLDMTSPTERWDAAYTFSELISEQARFNRNIMITAMSNAGFSNCRDEWWHWSYGDSAWAVRVGASTSCYGLVAPPEGFSFIPKPEEPPAEQEPEPVVEAELNTEEADQTK